MRKTRNLFVTAVSLTSLLSAPAANAGDTGALQIHQAENMDIMDAISLGDATAMFNSMADAELQQWMLEQASDLEQAPDQISQSGLELASETKQSFHQMADAIRAQSKSSGLRENLLKSSEHAGLTVVQPLGHAPAPAADILILAPPKFANNTVPPSGDMGDALVESAGPIAPAAVILGIGSGIAVQAACLPVSDSAPLCNNVGVIDKTSSAPAFKAGTATGSTAYLARQTIHGLAYEGKAVGNGAATIGAVSSVYFTLREDHQSSGPLAGIDVQYVVATDASKSAPSVKKGFHVDDTTMVKFNRNGKPTGGTFEEDWKKATASGGAIEANCRAGIAASGTRIMATCKGFVESKAQGVSADAGVKAHGDSTYDVVDALGGVGYRARGTTLLLRYQGAGSYGDYKNHAYFHVNGPEGDLKVKIGKKLEAEIDAQRFNLTNGTAGMTSTHWQTLQGTASETKLIARYPVAKNTRLKLEVVNNNMSASGITLNGGSSAPAAISTHALGYNLGVIISH